MVPDGNAHQEPTSWATCGLRAGARSAKIIGSRCSCGSCRALGWLSCARYQPRREASVAHQGEIRLTPRESEILRPLREGKSAREIVAECRRI